MARLRKITGILLVVSMLASAAFAGILSFEVDESVGQLRWRSGPVRIALSSSLVRESPNIKRESDVTGALKRSLDTWSAIANIEFQIVNSDKQNVSPAGPAGDGVSLITVAQTPENVLLFTKDFENAAATTRVFYNRRGMITEADIVLNPYQQFSSDGTLGTFDLESTFTREIGHLLGLRHSLVLGSTMHSNYGRNGVFGLRSYSPRTLSTDDIAAVRAIYGPREESGDCCGSIEGKIVMNGRTAANSQLWIEDTEGRVHGSVELSGDGSYSFSGLNEGRYRMFIQGIGRTKSPSSLEMIGEVEVAPGEVSVLNGKVAPMLVRDIELTHVGLNGQLSEVAVQLSPGRIYTLYVGGRSLDARRVNIGFSSSQLSVIPGSVKTLDYGDDISVLSFDVRIQKTVERGDYTILLETLNGTKRAIVGGLTIENSSDLTSNFTAFDY